jgi:hypothetical protein
MVPEGQLKGKVISFRIGNEEYQKLETFARNSGFASVSYLARQATLTCTPFEPVNTPLDVEMNRLWRRMEAVTASIEGIISQLSLALGDRRVAE